MSCQRTPLFLALLILMLSIVRAQDKGKQQDPWYNCLGGPAFGLEAAYDFNTFKGLQGHSASEVLYEIIMQADRPNDTFYPNGEHVSCLFQDSDFILDFGVGGKGVGINIEIDHPGTICAFAKDVPKGGLTLGEIRVLSRELIRHCSKCGRMTINYISKNESTLGWLEFDWKNNPICQENCIGPAKDLTTSNSSTINNSAGEGERGANGGVSTYGQPGVAIASLMGVWVVARLVM